MRGLGLTGWRLGARRVAQRPSGSELDRGGHQVWAQVGVIVCVASPCTAPLFFLSILFLPYGLREESSRSLHSAFGLEVVTI